MIEAMSYGTPVIAWRCGSVPEVMADGLTGFIVENDAQAIEAVLRLHEIDRSLVKATFERRFAASVMASGYVALYEEIIASINNPAPPRLEAVAMKMQQACSARGSMVCKPYI